MKEFRRKAFLIAVLIAMIALAQAWDGWADSGRHASRRAQSNTQRTPLERLTPEQQDQVRQNYLRFKSLPPQERERIQKNFREWQQLSPKEKERLRERYKQMKPPQERERIQKNFRDWQQLSPKEKERLRERYKQMKPQEHRGMGVSPGHRNPDRFRNGPP